MTTEPSDLCCIHGERIDRILQLMEDVHEARVPKFAEGGIVKALEGHEPPIVERGCDYVIHEAYLFTKDRPFPKQGHIINTPKFQAALEEFGQKYEEVKLGESRGYDSPNT